MDGRSDAKDETENGEVRRGARYWIGAFALPKRTFGPDGC